MTSTQCLRRPSCLTWVQWGLCQGRFPILKQDWRPARSPFGEHTCALWFTAALINLSVTSRSNPSMPSQTSPLDVPRLAYIAQPSLDMLVQSRNCRPSDAAIGATASMPSRPSLEISAAARRHSVSTVP